MNLHHAIMRSFVERGCFMRYGGERSDVELTVHARAIFAQVGLVGPHRELPPGDRRF